MLNKPGEARQWERDLAVCRLVLAQGSRSFNAAARLLPRRVRDPATAIYAFFRLADDAVDRAVSPRRGLATVEERLDQIYQAQPWHHPVDRAFARVVSRFQLPRAVPDGLLEGFAWDVEGRRYAELTDLIDYAVRVAGTVGVAMAIIMERRDRLALARACDLGVAMQLTNIARDVGEDARAGRVYLPLAWLHRGDVDLEEASVLLGGSSAAAVGGLVRRLVAHAEALYRRAESGIGMLPADCRPAILAARLIYAEIGRVLEERGYDSLSGRAVVSRRRKIWLLLRAATVSLLPAERAEVPAPPLPEATWLIDAVAGRS
jgi:phytoene synthase